MTMRGSPAKPLEQLGIMHRPEGLSRPSDAISLMRREFALRQDHERAASRGVFGGSFFGLFLLLWLLLVLQSFDDGDCGCPAVHAAALVRTLLIYGLERCAVLQLRQVLPEYLGKTDKESRLSLSVFRIDILLITVVVSSKLFCYTKMIYFTARDVWQASKNTLSWRRQRPPCLCQLHPTSPP